MSPGNVENLRRAALAKREAATRRADEGLRRLLKKGAPITFEAVAEEAGVSKDFLYRSIDLRPRIEQLRARQLAVSSHPPRQLDPMAGETSSVVRTLTIELRELRQRHRQEVAELKEALAAAHGELLDMKRRHGILN